jgi:tRNA-dihydrouridine synthase A
VPPLRHEVVHRLKLDFPGLTIVLNGGIGAPHEIAEGLSKVDGVMVGRDAYHHPWRLAQWDASFCGEPPRQPALERAAVEDAMVAYMTRLQLDHGEPWPRVARHMMGLYDGLPGARRWRQVWSDHRLKECTPTEVRRRAAAALGQALAETSTA